MRTLILALMAVSILALTAFTAGAVLVGSTETVAPTDHQVRSGGLGGNGQNGFLRNGAYDRLARGDMTGTGGGDMMGGMRGDMMGSMGGRGR
jgi:hypothetical protein